MQLDKNPAPPIHYPLLLVLIIVGVTVGNLLSNWISAEINEYRLQKSLEASAQALAKEMAQVRKNEQAIAQKTAIEAANQQRALEYARRISQEGQRLNQLCEEWRKTDAQLHSYTTAAEVAKHCGRYDRFVSSGN